jgi:hypothetical protein
MEAPKVDEKTPTVLVCFQKDFAFECTWTSALARGDSQLKVFASLIRGKNHGLKKYHNISY